MFRAVLGLLAGILFVAGDVYGRSRRDPIPKDYPSPVYPMEMEGSGRDGRATLLFVVREDGSVTDPVVEKASHPAFGYAAMEVIESWRFKPALRNGETVPVRVSQPFVFRAGPVRRVNAVLGRVVYDTINEIIYSPVEVGGLPEVTQELIAPYPRKYEGSGHVEVVNVTMVVGPDGRGYNMEIEGYPPSEFVLSAILTASRYRFKPVTYQGKKVYVYTRLTIVIAEDGPSGRGGRDGDRAIGDPNDRYSDYPDF